MRIVHVITSLNRGGAETQLLTLAKLQATENEVTVYSLRGKGALTSSFANAGVRVVETNVKSIPLLFFRFRKLLKANNYDIVHAHLPRAELFARLTLLGSSTALVITRHNHEPFIPRTISGGSFISRLLSIWVTSRASCVIAISEAVVGFLEKQKEVSKKSKIQRIYYGYEAGIKHSNTRRLKGLKEPFVIGTVSRLVPQKHLDVLLKAFAALDLTDGNYQLKVVGSGNQEKWLKDLATDLQISRFISWLPNTSERLELLADFDLFVLPSRYEGFGLVLLEAIQLGIPVLASNNTAIKEVLGEDYIGLFPTGDVSCLVEKIHTFRQFSNLEREGIEEYLNSRLQRFLPETMLRGVMRCYNTCLGK